MPNVNVGIVKEGKDIKLHIHPDSIAMMVADFKEQGLTDEAIVIEFEKIKESIMADYNSQVENGTIDEDDFNTESCGDPNCPNCSGGVTYH